MVHPTGGCGRCSRPNEKPPGDRRKVPDREWRKDRLMNRYTEHLFRDILAPINRSNVTHTALEQAVQIARLENATIHGLHIVKTAEN